MLLLIAQITNNSNNSRSIILILTIKMTKSDDECIKELKY